MQALRNRANLQSRMGTASAALVATGVNLDESSSDSDDDDDESSSSDDEGNDEVVKAGEAGDSAGQKEVQPEGEGKGGDDSDGSDGEAKNTEGRQPATIAVSFKGITTDNSNNDNNDNIKKEKKRRKSSFAFGGIPFSGKNKKVDTEEKAVFAGIRPRTRPLYLPQLVYTDAVEGPDFQTKVLECATFESDTNEVGGYSTC